MWRKLQKYKQNYESILRQEELKLKVIRHRITEPLYDSRHLVQSERETEVMCMENIKVCKNKLEDINNQIENNANEVSATNSVTNNTMNKIVHDIIGNDVNIAIICTSYLSHMFCKRHNSCCNGIFCYFCSFDYVNFIPFDLVYTSKNSWRLTTNELGDEVFVLKNHLLSSNFKCGNSSNKNMYAKGNSDKKNINICDKDSFEDDIFLDVISKICKQHEIIRADVYDDIGFIVKMSYIKDINYALYLCTPTMDNVKSRFSTSSRNRFNIGVYFTFNLHFGSDKLAFNIKAL